MKDRARALLEERLWELAADWAAGQPGPRTRALLEDSGPEEIPESFLEFLAPALLDGPSSLRSAALQVSAHALLAEELHRRVSAASSLALATRRVPHVFIKGADLRYRVYPDAARRPLNDLDVLVGPADRTRAVEALTEAGAVPLEPAERFLAGGPHTLTFRWNGASLDLHAGLLQEGRSRFAAEEVIARAGSVGIDGGSLPVPEPEDEVAICLVHIGRHEGAAEYVDVKHGLDILLAQRAWPDLRWDVIGERTRAWRCFRLAAAGLWSWRSALVGHLPDRAWRELDPGLPIRLVAGRTRRVLGAHRVRARGVARLAQLGRKWLFAEGARERLWLLRELTGRGRDRLRAG